MNQKLKLKVQIMRRFYDRQEWSQPSFIFFNTENKDENTVTLMAIKV